MECPKCGSKSYTRDRYMSGEFEKYINGRRTIHRFIDPNLWCYYCSKCDTSWHYEGPNKPIIGNGE